MRRTRAAALACLATAVSSTVLALASSPVGAVTTTWAITGRISVTTAGSEPAAQELGDFVLSNLDGRFVAFTTDAALDPADTNAKGDVYLRDRMGGTTARISLNDADAQISGDSEVCGMSRDSRYVGFTAIGAGAQVPGTIQLYLRDRKEATTTIVSVSSNEVPSANGAESGVWENDACPVSDDGRYVAFVSDAASLAPGDNNGTKSDVFRRDLQLGVTDRMSQSTGGALANSYAEGPAMSANGQVVAFASLATNLVPNDTNAKWDVFVRLLATSQTFRMSVKPGGAQVLANSEQPAISANGNIVAFESQATDLVAGDTNAHDDVFVRNRTADTVVRASVFGANTQMAGSSSHPALSDDGRYLAFVQYNPNPIVDDQNSDDDVFRRDLVSAQTTLVSITHDGAAGDGQAYEHDISGDGLVVPFQSAATDLVRSDANQADDVFARDYAVELTPFASPTALIKQQFVDFEGRQPTAAELAEWYARLTNGERTPDELIDELAHGAHWSAKRGPLTRLYWAFFRRAPDLGGMDYWTNKLTTGTKLAAVAKQFAASSEFKTKYGSKTNSQFVTLIYQNIFDRDPDAGGLAYWTGKLDSKAKTRGDVRVNFSDSSEGRRVLAPMADTVLIWLGATRTMPTSAIMLEGISALRSGYPPEVVAESVRELADYAARVVQGP